MMSTKLINEMNRRVEEAGERLEDLHTDLDKDLRLNSPYPYSPEHQFVCDFKSHDPKMYDAYWYHPDHLGSSSYITNTSGEISQHMEYLPFGETLVEEHLNSYNSPFKFNGKEYDAETGNYYYGARYMNPKWSTFLSPDPALESYPGISPYAYTLNNPIRYVDPTGMYVEDPIGRFRKFKRNVKENAIQVSKAAVAYGANKVYDGAINYGKKKLDALKFGLKSSISSSTSGSFLTGGYMLSGSSGGSSGSSGDQSLMRKAERGQDLDWVDASGFTSAAAQYSKVPLKGFKNGKIDATKFNVFGEFKGNLELFQEGMDAATSIKTVIMKAHKTIYVTDLTTMLDHKYVEFSGEESKVNHQIDSLEKRNAMERHKFNNRHKSFKDQ